MVISPLIALMKDQVDALREKGIAAARLDSTLSQEDYAEVMGGLKAGSLKLLYVAPERLANEGFRHRLSRLKIGMIAIDELAVTPLCERAEQPQPQIPGLELLVLGNVP